MVVKDVPRINDIFSENNSEIGKYRHNKWSMMLNAEFIRHLYRHMLVMKW